MSNMEKRHGRVQKHELAEFLQRYVETKFNFARAAEHIGRHRNTIQRILERDDEFREAFEATKQLAADNVFAEAYRRAVEGTDKPVYQGGELVGYIREYSDTLIGKFLEAYHPEFKRKSSVEVSGPGGRPIEFNDQQLAAKLSSIFAVARQRMIEGECEDITDRKQIEHDEDDFEDLL